MLKNNHIYFHYYILLLKFKIIFSKNIYSYPNIVSLTNPTLI